MQRVKNNVTTTGFPLYDGHGNMVATLARSGSNSWSLNDKRYFDAWGDVDNGAGTGQPSQRYCANLGHVQDDESDLIYMRARYYEPSSGRFLSQDHAKDGFNWYSYCDSDPVHRVDQSGKSSILTNSLFALGMIFSALGIILSKVTATDDSIPGALKALATVHTLGMVCAILSLACFAGALVSAEMTLTNALYFTLGNALLGLSIATLLEASYEGLGKLSTSVVGALAASLCAANLGMICGALIWALLGE